MGNIMAYKQLHNKNIIEEQLDNLKVEFGFTDEQLKRIGKSISYVGSNAVLMRSFEDDSNEWLKNNT